MRKRKWHRRSAVAPQRAKQQRAPRKSASMAGEGAGRPPAESAGTAEVAGAPKGIASRAGEPKGIASRAGAAAVGSSWEAGAAAGSAGSGVAGAGAWAACSPLADASGAGSAAAADAASASLRPTRRSDSLDQRCLFHKAFSDETKAARHLAAGEADGAAVPAPAVAAAAKLVLAVAARLSSA